LSYFEDWAGWMNRLDVKIAPGWLLNLEQLTIIQETLVDR
jgi:hypothetical protein